MRELLTLGLCVLALACSVDQTTSFDGNAGSGGADSGSSGSGGGGLPGAENCENGVDDDADGQVDCADDECSTYACAPAVPAEWTGPVALYLGTDAPPDCGASGGFAGSVVEGGTLDVPGYTCPVCSCNPATATCTPTVISYTDPDCTGQQLSKTGVGCQQFDSNSSQDSIRLQFNPPGGACTASAETPTIPPPTFPEKARICALPAGSSAGAGCFAEACVPKPAAPFQLCIYRADATPCPNGYPVQHTIATTFDDQRGCAPCTCTTNCTATAVAYDFCGDPTPLATANTFNQCVNLSSGQQYLDVVMTGTVDCPPTGGGPVGEVVRTELTLCCKG